MVNVPKIPGSASANPDRQVPDGSGIVVKIVDRKVMWVAYVLAIMGGGGMLGLHRFYLGYTRSAQVQLGLGVCAFLVPFLLGLVGQPLILIALVWNIVDLFLIPGLTRKANGEG